MIILIAATDLNGVIGRDNELPWRQPSDLKRFSQLTSGHWVVMGRKTFESIGQPLKGRRNMILTRNSGYRVPEGCLRMSSPRLAADWTRGSDLYVIGGEKIYRQFLPLAGRIELTRILTEVQGGDTHFPALGEEWQLVDQQFVEAGPRDDHDMEFLTFVRAAR
ncbi:dihydrofolate reductase [Deinococcus sp. 6YEL10]|uniref:dihydrofolate reductase n=1 Tax=Deinococcus sp. 6YEL10 TaxID=2745870 RepID=UPI001E55F096|nr:dihydrofolate reductase [Deinococcus sp. 6YEL10]MCD0159777.1 dihydrofolate reductase [Deinococcus sp. 6YEL10]